MFEGQAAGRAKQSMGAPSAVDGNGKPRAARVSRAAMPVTMPIYAGRMMEGPRPRLEVPLRQGEMAGWASGAPKWGIVGGGGGGGDVLSAVAAECVRCFLGNGQGYGKIIGRIKCYYVRVIGLIN